MHHKGYAKEVNNKTQQRAPVHNIITSLPDGMECEDFPLSGPEGSGPIPVSSIGGRSISGFGPYGPLPSTLYNGI